MIRLPLLLSLLCACLAASQPAFSKQPNIVVILADDLGYSDIGCYGSEIETPHLDALARGGLRFTQFYNTSRCCPTRAALLTGLHQHQAGIGHMAGDDGIPSYQGYLNDRCITLAEALKPAGYTTLMTGKWHVGSAPGQWPLDRGFDRYWGTPSGGGVYFKDTLQIRKEVFFVSGSETVELPDDFYSTDTFTDHALHYIKEAVTETRKPFFLYLAHIAPHWPLQAKPADIAKYKGRYDIGWDAVREQRFARQKELGILPPDAVLSPRDEKAGDWSALSAAEQKALSHRMAVYAAQVDCLDQNVGRLVAALKEHGQLENTLILFLSDNGCSAEGGPGGFSRGMKDAPIGTGLSYASAGLEWANVSDTPFRKFKTFTHEGGIATPLIVHWPAGIADAGALRQDPAHVMDLMPTLVDIGAATYPQTRNEKPVLPMEGLSLRPVFSLPAGQTTALPERPLYWEHEGNKSIRLGGWKAVAKGRGPWALYNLKTDRAEQQDQAAAQPEKLSELSALWQAWAKRSGVWEWDDLQKHRHARQPKKGKNTPKKKA